ncbi:MAG: IS1595 family transposase [Desulfomonilaceae bacterium]
MQDKDLNLVTLSPIFADEDKARKLIESKLWPNGPVCPHCGYTRAYQMLSREGAKKPMTAGSYKCAACRKRFTVRIGTIFEESPLPLCKWLMAIHLMTSSKKGISSSQLARELEITIKTAWFLSHRIREAMTEKYGDLLSGTVQVDEGYFGGKPRKGTGPHKRGRGTAKTPVVVLVERDGKARTQRVDRVNSKELKGIIRAHVEWDSKIVTDEFLSYRGIGKEFTGGHSVVHHSSEQFVNDEGEHTNTAESFFALMKRGHYGIFHSLSKQHLQRYANEFAFRWNYRKVSDGERMVEAIKGAEGKRLMYRMSATN